jgi:hypothetical protein
MNSKIFRGLIGSLLLAAAGQTVQAAGTTVSFTGTIVGSCTLSISTPGTLKLNTGGNMLSSEEVGALPATVAVIAVGGQPTINFTAPAFTTTPGGYNHTPTVELKYTSLGGANQAYTTGTSSYTASLLLDTIVVNAKATDTGGFLAGTYVVGTTATCQQ